MRRLFAALVVSGVVACSASVGNGLNTTGGPGCASLNLCCPQLAGGSQSVCDTVVTDGDDSVCTEELMAYESSGACALATMPGPGADAGADACTALIGCCQQMSGAALADCDAVVAEGVSATCATDLAGYLSGQLCTPVAPGHDAGTDGSILHIPDAGGGTDVYHPQDAVAVPDTGNCGPCGADCTDGCGNACTSNTCGTCVQFCLTDEDCASSCPSTPGGVSCCDQTTGSCFVSGSLSCPVTPSDAGPDTGMGY